MTENLDSPVTRQLHANTYSHVRCNGQQKPDKHLPCSGTREIAFTKKSDL
jgi:hypothetical protein